MPHVWTTPLRKLYWNNDRLRRSLNWVRSQRFTLVLLFLSLAYMRCDESQVREEIKIYGSAATDANSRATKLNEQLRISLEEQRVLRYELDSCRVGNNGR